MKFNLIITKINTNTLKFNTMLNLNKYSNKQLLILRNKLNSEINERREKAFNFLINTGGIPNQKGQPHEKENVKRILSLYTALPTRPEDQPEDNGYDYTISKEMKKKNVDKELNEYNFKCVLDMELNDIQEHIQLGIPFNMFLDRTI